MSDDAGDSTFDPLIGKTIEERFLVEKKLGHGGMGAIYLAQHLRLKKNVAIKCLHAGLASNPTVVKRFKNEAVAASSIGHPNIVDVMDMGRFEDGTFFMVLEFLDGRDWQVDLDESGAQPVSKVAHVGTQVCGALSAAAAKGIVHRDLKPENIFLIERYGDENFVKVLDFGISKILDGTGGATKTGELMGTPYYMAPEQVLGEKDITHLADVYALGVIFFQALSGTVPFEGETLAQVIMKIATQATPSLDERVSGLPEPLVRLVAQMMERDPAARPQTFQEVASRLEQFVADPSIASSRAMDATKSTVLAGSAGTLPKVAASAGTRSIDRPAAPPTWLVVAGAAVLLGLGVWIFSGSGDDTQVEETEEQAANAVRLRISTVPEGATLTLDGESIANPFDAMLERDDESHELVVKRSGFKTEMRKIVLTADQQIVIPLTKEPDEPAPSPRPAANTSPSPSSGSSPSPSPSPSSNDDTPKPLRKLERGLRKLF